MELNLDKISYEGKWYDFGNGRLKIRPYPASKQNLVVKDKNITFLGEQGFEQFEYCLVEWDNYVKKGTKDKIVLDSEVKRKVYDFHLGIEVVDGKKLSISDFVLLKNNEISEEIQEAEKN